MKKEKIRKKRNSREKVLLNTIKKIIFHNNGTSFYPFKSISDDIKFMNKLYHTHNTKSLFSVEQVEHSIEIEVKGKFQTISNISKAKIGFLLTLTRIFFSFFPPRRDEMKKFKNL